jgi:hypothetical protein
MNSVVRRNVVFVGENLEFQLLSNGGSKNSNSARNDLRALFPVAELELKGRRGQIELHSVSN